MIIKDQKHIIPFATYAAEDPRLSLQALGLHTWLITRPPPLELEASLAARNESRGDLWLIVQELMDAGYLSAEPTWEAGEIIGSHLVLRESQKEGA